MTPLIKILNMTKAYPLGDTELVALNQISLKIFEGESVIISGPSGSGKSTLMQLIGCLDRPTSGSIAVGGCDLVNINDKALTEFRAQNIGFIFQNFNLIPVLNVFENVEYPLIINKVSNRREKVMDILDKVGLADFAKHTPNALSGGQRQRVSIARALVHQPKLLIADEPTANLDTKTGDSVMDVMFNMTRYLNTTVVMTSHDPAIMAMTDKRQLRVVDGVLVQDSMPELHEAIAANE